MAIIAREVLRIVQENATIDWTVRENVRANLRRLVKRVLRKYGYPPNKQEIATQTVIQQAELLAGIGDNPGKNKLLRKAFSQLPFGASNSILAQLFSQALSFQFVGAKLNKGEGYNLGGYSSRFDAVLWTRKDHDLWPPDARFWWGACLVL